MLSVAISQVILDRMQIYMHIKHHGVLNRLCLTPVCAPAFIMLVCTYILMLKVKFDFVLILI